MNTIADEQFLDWAKDRGIGLDPRYSPPQCLVYLDMDVLGRFWIVPKVDADRARFVQRVLTGLEPWRSCRLWPRGGKWRSASQPRNRLEEIRRLVQFGPAVPADFAGALQYEAGESNWIESILLRNFAEGCCARDDLFLIPDHARQIVQTDHHDVVHLSCREEQTLSRFVTHMAEGGFDLPSDLPDETFKRPGWMTRV